METALIARDLAAVERRLRGDADELDALLTTGEFDDEAARFAVASLKKRAAELEVIRRSL